MNEFIHLLFVCFILFGFASNSLKDFPSTCQVAKSVCVFVFMVVLQVQGICLFPSLFWVCFNQLERHTRVLALSLCVLVEMCVRGSVPIPSIGMCVSVSLLTFSSCQGSLWTYFHYNCFTFFALFLFLQ